MKLVDLLILVPVAVIVFFAVRRTVRIRKNGGCGCGCDGCRGRCDRKL